MKKAAAVIFFFCVTITYFAGVLYAGSLDRQPVQSRTNEATQSMLRVPGVVGQDQATAMSTLQQAGLGVSVFEAKKLPKGMEGAKNMEGKVVSQTPGPGGMAMYGTTVSIYVFKLKEEVSGSSETYTDTSWGTSDYSSYNSQSQATYSGTQVQQQTYQQMGTTGTSTQSSQPFQVQQYYFPSASETAESNQATNESQSSSEDNTYQEQSEQDSYQSSTDSNADQPAGETNTGQQDTTSGQNTAQQTSTPAQ